MLRFAPTEVWNHLPEPVQQDIIKKRLKFYVIDAYKVARETGMADRINTIMQTCFFAISGVLPREEAIEAIKDAVRDTYGKRGEAVVEKNFAAVDRHSCSSAPCERSGASVERFESSAPGATEGSLSSSATYWDR